MAAVSDTVASSGRVPKRCPERLRLNHITRQSGVEPTHPLVSGQVVVSDEPGNGVSKLRGKCSPLCGLRKRTLDHNFGGSVGEDDSDAEVTVVEVTLCGFEQMVPTQRPSCSSSSSSRSLDTEHTALGWRCHSRRRWCSSASPSRENMRLSPTTEPPGTAGKTPENRAISRRSRKSN